MPSGAILRIVRPLDCIKVDLDAGPDEYRVCDAAAVLGVQQQTLTSWRTSGRVTATRHGRSYVFGRAALWRLAQDVHGVTVYELDVSDAARTAVLRMLARWQGCAPTAQELHDAAGVRPLPPLRDDHGGKHAAGELEEVVCARCGDTYQRPVDSGARWTMCRRCVSTVRQRAARLTREYVGWCGQRAG